MWFNSNDGFLSADSSRLIPSVFVRLQLSRINGGGSSSPQASPHSGGGLSARVAAVCPYIQAPAEGRQEAGYPPPADPPLKPTPLGHIRSLSGSWTQFVWWHGFLNLWLITNFLFPFPVCWLLHFLFPSLLLNYLWFVRVSGGFVTSVMSRVDVVVLPIVILLLLFRDTGTTSSQWRCVAVMVGVLSLSFYGGCGLPEEDRSGIRKPPSQWKVSDLDVILSESTETCQGPPPHQGSDSYKSEFPGGVRELSHR